MPKKKILSETMMECISHAHDHGDGFLIRCPGGFWVVPKDKGQQPHCQFYGSKSITALVERGAGEYVDWVEGRHGRFPVKVQFKDMQAINALRQTD